MNNFFSRARSLRDDPDSALTLEEREVFGRVIQYRFELDKALAKVLVDPDNIEQLFGFLEMELRLSPGANVALRKDMTVGKAINVGQKSRSKGTRRRRETEQASSDKK